MTPPPTGYSFDSIHTVRANYGTVSEPDEGLDIDRNLSFLWDWRITGARKFSVVLGAKIGPSETALDEMEAVVVGNFELVGEVQSVDLRAFVELNAPALLMPYLRQALTSLSAQGPIGAFYLPPVNVKVLSEEFDVDAAAGAIQLEDDPLLIGAGSE